MILGTILMGLLVSLLIYLILFSKVIHPINRLYHRLSLIHPTSQGNEIERISSQVAILNDHWVDSEKRLADQHKKIDTIFSLQYNIENPPPWKNFTGRLWEFSSR